MEQLTLAHVSKHLTDNIVENVFKLKSNSKDIIKKVEVMRAAPAGEGLISAVYRIRVTGDNQTTCFIVKGFVQDTLLRRSLNCINLFRREALFFSNILPVLIANQKELGAKESIQDDVPVCYGCHIDGQNDFILMEDLSEKKFESMSEYPTRSERDMTLKALAHLHSVSLALRINKPEVFKETTEQLNEIYYNDDNRPWYTNYLNGAVDIDKAVLEEIDGPNGVYYNKFKELIKGDLYGELIRLTTTRGNHPVMNHGDAWCPNFLCSRDKAVAIDFQLLRCASAATDLSCFIIMCSNLCRNKEDFLDAIDIYYKATDFYLNDMGIKASEVFSYDTLMEELKTYGKFGVLAALTMIPLLGSERCDVLQSYEQKYAGRDKIPLEELWRLTPLTSEEHKMRLLNAIRVAVDLGLI